MANFSNKINKEWIMKNRKYIFLFISVMAMFFAALLLFIPYGQYAAFWEKAHIGEATYRGWPVKKLIPVKAFKLIKNESALQDGVAYLALLLFLIIIIVDILLFALFMNKIWAFRNSDKMLSKHVADFLRRVSIITGGYFLSALIASWIIRESGGYMKMVFNAYPFLLALALEIGYAIFVKYIGNDVNSASKTQEDVAPDKGGVDVTATIAIFGIIIVALICLASKLRMGWLLYSLAVILVAVAMLRCKKIIENKRFAKVVADLRKKEESKQGTYYKNNSAQPNIVQPKKTEITSNSFLGRVKEIAQNCAVRMQSQKFASYESMENLCQKLTEYIAARGIKLNEKTAETIIQAMTSSKCIFVKNTGENVEEIIELVEEFFNGEKGECLQFEVPPTTPSGVFYRYQDNNLAMTPFFQKLYTASLLVDSVQICSIKNFSEFSFETVFFDFIRLFKNPYEECACTLAQLTAKDLPNLSNKKFVIPSNAWFFFLVNGNEELPKDVALWSETIELRGVGNTLDKKADVGLPMAYTQVEELIEGAFNEHFLPLDSWKKLDRVEDYLYNAIQFKIDNLLARELERFTTMQIVGGATQAQAMDAALARKILPLLKGCTREQIETDGTSFKDFLNSVFGAENLTECHKTLSVLQLD